MKTKQSITIKEDGSATHRSIGIKKEDGKRRQKTTVYRKVSGLDLFEKPADSFILPVNTRFYKINGPEIIFVIEEPPKVRTTFWSGGFVERNRERAAEKKIDKLRNMPKKNSFNLAFPYVVYIIKFCNNQFSHLRLYYRTEPLRSTKDFVFEPNLPNIGSGTYNEVCIGSEVGAAMSRNKDQTFSRQVELIISSFWGSEFNTDLAGHFYNYGSRDNAIAELRTLWLWEKASQENPLFPLRVCWNGLTEPIGKQIERSIRCHSNILPAKRTELFNYLKQKAAKAKSIEKKKKKVNPLVKSFTEKGETFSVGDTFLCVRAYGGFKRGHVYAIKDFTECGGGRSASGCSAKRHCPRINLEGFSGDFCLFSGDSLRGFLTRQ